MADDRCLYCGEIIPEGRQVCPDCEAAFVGNGVTARVTLKNGHKITVKADSMSGLLRALECIEYRGFCIR